jgi:Inner membrane protein YgaP-like, transmembrane domain
MKIFSVIGIFAGLVIMGSLTGAHFMGQIDLASMSWLWLTFFVGANLFQMGFTGFCPATKMLYAIGVKDKQSGCSI